MITGNAPAASACKAGVCTANGSCTTYGGAFEGSDPGAPACPDTNRYTQSCGCPTGFHPTTLRTINDSNSAIGVIQWGGNIGACIPDMYFIDTSEFGGVFEDDDPVPGRGCRVPSVAGACTCRKTRGDQFRTLVDIAPGQIIGSHVSFCRSCRPTTTYGGAFQNDDPVPGGAGCRVPNPATGACTCPPNFAGQGLRVEVDGTNSFMGSTIVLCGDARWASATVARKITRKPAAQSRETHATKLPMSSRVLRGFDRALIAWRLLGAAPSSMGMCMNRTHLVRPPPSAGSARVPIPDRPQHRHGSVGDLQLEHARDPRAPNSLVVLAHYGSRHVTAEARDLSYPPVPDPPRPRYMSEGFSPDRTFRIAGARERLLRGPIGRR